MGYNIAASSAFQRPSPFVLPTFELGDDTGKPRDDLIKSFLTYDLHHLREHRVALLLCLDAH